LKSPHFIIREDHGRDFSRFSLGTAEGSNFTLRRGTDCKQRNGHARHPPGEAFKRHEMPGGQWKQNEKRFSYYFVDAHRAFEAQEIPLLKETTGNGKIR